MTTKINPELVAVVLDATKGEIARQLAAGNSPCGWNGCPAIATHLLVIEAWGDGKIYAVLACGGHFAYLQSELEAQPDHLYTKQTNGAKWLKSETQH